VNKIFREIEGDWLIIQFPRKASKREIIQSVPQTNTGRWDEYSQASRKTILKELGKLAGRKLCKMPFRSKIPRLRGDSERTQRKTVSRLFN